MTETSRSPDALIGHTGFVGGTLDRSGWPFGARFNSRNIAEMAGGRFGTVVCAGVSAVKWKANREPEADMAGIERLWSVLDTIEADRFALVSTVDIYPTPLGVTEDDRPDPDAGEPYGRHRRELERRVAARFPRHCILRLPGLFGHGLRKNLVFDLLTGNMTDKINPAGLLQWYPMRRFAADLRIALESGLPLLNIAVEPLATGVIAERLFPGMPIGAPQQPAPCYDMRTRHAALLGGSGDYHLDASGSLRELGDYVAAARGAGVP